MIVPPGVTQSACLTLWAGAFEAAAIGPGRFGAFGGAAVRAPPVGISRSSPGRAPWGSVIVTSLPSGSGIDSWSPALAPAGTVTVTVDAAAGGGAASRAPNQPPDAFWGGSGGAPSASGICRRSPGRAPSGRVIVIEPPVAAADAFGTLRRSPGRAPSGTVSAIWRPSGRVNAKA